MAAVMALRAAVHNLCSTPAKELPLTTEYIATIISDCSAILSAPANQNQHAGAPDRALLVQKLKARITSLLQDKTVEGRWSGVVLVKSTVEAGQWEILRGCETWVRSILAILGKPDPLSLKKLNVDSGNNDAYSTAIHNRLFKHHIHQATDGHTTELEIWQFLG
ncbi:uncharacterized protein GIQ15_05168 [Arthroderma uncinatum]|uniref:uncharacterized protein n=1 Tax=Arthroderma uncinatum TaxID=74035 RepID=UPI00144AEB53|nr:uncharacterized protein GIQ15_05168 [Arthroderma uncinatum]KAF3482409.1 hypothetical protein GIQ15_05168 [Arthroderma uncinatum]